MKTLATTRAELAALADELDKQEHRLRILYARRLRLWKEARAREVSAAYLAESSRVSAVTVRQLIRQSLSD